MVDKKISKSATIAKLIAIVLVIYIHADVNVGLIDNRYQWLNNIEYIFSQIIARSAVPMFFLISGYFSINQINRSYLTILKNKSKSLLTPYIFWNLVWILVYFIGQNINFLSPYFQNHTKIISNFGVKQYLHAFGLISVKNSSRPFLYPLWFIRDLLIINLLFPLIKLFIKNKNINKCILLILFFGYMNAVKIGIIEIQGIFFFLLGLTIAKEKYDISKSQINKIYLACFLYVVLIYLKFKFHLIYSLELSNIIGIFLIWNISLKLSNSNKLIYFSNFTMLIFLLHEWNLSFIRKVIFRMLGENNISLIFNYFFLPWLIIGLSIILGKFLKKYCLRIYNFITGNR